MKKTKTQKGITLIALIITVVILIILAAVSIYTIKDNNIISYTNGAAQEVIDKQESQNGSLQNFKDFLNDPIIDNSIDFPDYEPDDEPDDEPDYSICAHIWNNGEVTKVATCASTGTRTYTCTICGATKTNTISKLSHNTSANYFYKNRAFHIYVEYCSNGCGYVLLQEQWHSGRITYKSRYVASAGGYYNYANQLSCEASCNGTTAFQITDTLFQDLNNVTYNNNEYEGWYRNTYGSISPRTEADYISSSNNLYSFDIFNEANSNTQYDIATFIGFSVDYVS